MAEIGSRRRQAVAWAALALLSIGLHLWDLGGRTFHHDESIHAQLSFELASEGRYRYDPTYHGPLLYYLTAATYAVVGDSDLTARLPVALAGILMVLVAWHLRGVIGPRAAWFSGLLFTISPLFLYYGRFLRMDVLEAALASAALLSLRSALRGRWRAWAWLGLWAGLAFATKENAYVTAALLVASGVGVAVERFVRSTAREVRSRPGWGGPGRLLLVRELLSTAPAASGVGLARLWRWIDSRWVGVLAATSAFIVVTVPIHTVGFVRPEDWLFPVKAIAHWWHQHSIQRVGGPWWFHLPRLLQYEFLVLAAATVWVVRRWRRLHRIEAFLFFFGVSSVAMYCYLGEKVPWLGVHQVWPFVPLAGAQLARTLSPRGRRWGQAVSALAIAATAFVAVIACFVLDEISPGQPRVESLIFVQTCPAVRELVDEIEGVAGEGEALAAAVSGEAAWPLNWYWRHQGVWWGLPEGGTRPPLVVCDLAEESATRIALGPGYSRERIPLRAWWLMYEGRPGPWGFARYLVTRRPWGSIGSTDVVVLRRLGVAPPAFRQAETPAPLRDALGAGPATVLAEGWLAEPRGVAVRARRIAVADVALSRVSVISISGEIQEGQVSTRLTEPEAVAWSPEGDLLIADTWGHRVLRMPGGGRPVTVLPSPSGGWYGPRSLAAGPDGRVAVADTGTKRVVIYEAGGAGQRELGRPGSGPGELVEPVGVAWVDHDSVLVCDTGNRRLQVFNLRGDVERVIELPEAWSDFYSRPQAAVLEPDRWLVTDPPARALWLVEDGAVTRLDLGDHGLRPAGLGWDPEERMLALSDLGGKVWIVEVPDG